MSGSCDNTSSPRYCLVPLDLRSVFQAWLIKVTANRPKDTILYSSQTSTDTYITTVKGFLYLYTSFCQKLLQLSKHMTSSPLNALGGGERLDYYSNFAKILIKKKHIKTNSTWQIYFICNRLNCLIVLILLKCFAWKSYHMYSTRQCKQSAVLIC